MSTTPEPPSNDARPAAAPAGSAAEASDEMAALRAELAQARAESARLREQLDAAQTYGQLGVWTRDIPCEHTHWDPALLRLWGLDPVADAHASIARMLERVVTDDREGFSHYFAASERRLGPHAMRLRLFAAHGMERRVQVQWDVLPDALGRPAKMVGVVIDDSETLAQLGVHGELESQLALAVELGNVLIWRHDIARGRIMWSKAGWRTLGLVPRPEGLSLQEVRDLIHPDDLLRVQASVQQALDTNLPVDLEARYRHADGQWRTQLLRRVVLRDDRGEAVAFMGVALDITERLQQQRRVQAMAARFDAVARAAGIGHWVHEAENDHLEWSPECRLMHGIGPDEPLPVTREWLAAWVHPDDRERVRLALKQELPGLNSPGLDLTLRIVRRDGEVRHLISHTRIEGHGGARITFGVLIDVTERVRAEVALRGAQERVELALRGAGIATWEFDLDTRQTLWDDQMWRLRGREPQAQTPSLEEIWQWAHPDDRESTWNTYRQAEGASVPLDNEFRVVWPDGQVRWLATRSAELRGPDGRRRRIGVNWDVTVARSALDARREGELARRESQAKSQFLARMSHELRTPLNAVLGFAQLMVADEHDDSPASATRRRRLNHVQSAGRHLLELIDDVLTLSGVEGGELPLAADPVALAETLEQVRPMLLSLQEQSAVTWTQDVPETLHVRGDATRLRQVLLNLLGNAIKYNRPGGTVHVAAQASGGADAVVALRVTDTGRGLDETQIRHLFEPFNRLGAERSAIQGTGIGLAIVKALVERMKGTIRVQSEPGQGSTFTVELPAAAPGPAPGAAAAPHGLPDAVGSQVATGAHTLLYIEDNPVNALIIAELVARRSDLSLHIAPDGASGVSQARALRPDLVLLDMQLPDIEGFEVLRRLRADAATASIPVIALSANAMPEDIDRAIAAGCADYWTKPLDFRAFMAGLDTLFGKAR